MNTGRKDILEFSKLTDENFESVINSDNATIKKIREIDNVFDEAVSGLGSSDFLLQPFFFIRAHSLYRSSLRIGLGGQLPETYPLLRALLENALYAWYLKRHPEFNSIWMKRMDGVPEKKEVKKKFQLKAMLDELKSNNIVGEPIFNLYENFIDYGAHPNVFGVVAEHEFTKKESGGELYISYLYGDGPFFRLVLKDLSRAGIGALLLFEDIFHKDFERLSLNKKIRSLAEGL